MMRINDCDKDAMYCALQNIGINMRDLVGTSPTTGELIELYTYLLRMQLTAWKAGKGYHELVRETNRALRDESRMLKASKMRKPDGHYAF